jgi:hypothetical protein
MVMDEERARNRLSKTRSQTLTELRKRGVVSVQQGERPEVVAAASGINRTTIYDWPALCRRGGWGALEAR